ncbi:MAG: polysaccharide deacetylase family protein [Clostridia bacterium]|nr:polysaccharide deacetylase family protein [Clostridia bacterium]
MKFIYFKKNTMITYLSFIVILGIAIYSTYIITKTISYHKIVEENEEESICDEEEICEDVSPRKELLIKQYQNKKLIALTFDDGPSKYTENLVDELQKRNVPATFFILGQSAEDRLDTLKFELDAGNEIGIHSYTHKLFTKLSETEILEQIEHTRKVINKVSDKEIQYIRVPYGSRNKKVDNALEKGNLVDVLWNVDSKDWKFKNTSKTYNYVLKKVKGNDIILMHDTFKTSVEAAIKIVDKLLSECYTFVTVSEFYEIKEIVTNQLMQ